MKYNNQLARFGAMEDMSKTVVGDDLILDFPFGKKTVKHFRQIVPVQIHHFYIIDEIKDVDAYVNMINTLKTSEPHDTIFIYLNTPGGNLNTTLQIMSAIKQSNATVVTCMEGAVASAGTMIFLTGHKHMVGPNTFFMAHNYSGGVIGKGFEMKTRQKFDEKYFLKLVKNTYDGFLTETEISDIMEDRDVWLDADEVIKRIPQNKLISLQQPEDQTQNIIADLLQNFDPTTTGPIKFVGVPTSDSEIPAKKPKKKPEPKKPVKTRKKKEVVKESVT